MFEDLKYTTLDQEQIQELEKWKSGATDLLREGRDEIKRLEKEKTFYENKYVDVFSDNKRLLKRLKENTDEKTFEKIMSEDEDIEVDVELEDDQEGQNDNDYTKY